ncbi:molybdopterin-guanine dinucleotide biosynthesis protein B [Azospirillum oryzae]|uniref:Molybdopterin-guanine dinucleotide biosynthesis protein B n=1 Tax=Azospirillum oryzae TaxID=286727 RepID=A0A6N1AKM4_9PROT|nr:molybdopterin-guanine dinucleotide biosynthesis protein B [Azospirillum oryzae]KAA0590794.1 molybdopterin-guanine dinucleotide biosynthesis protein B [Azospirillum oryzae]QKS52080.1 molybdopterin-guanine dinucleotide biosynthesis protein B [Azospirillum oryzae]GLR77878.1 molybdopterin-guanine dinucleotide biosynthesis protein B [Azospirillum oryzae]
MKIFGLTGWSGSGKTSLMVRLIPALTARGLRVSTVKHAHKGFDIDHPGKDSHNHRLAGATEVLVSSPRRWALMHELRDGEPELTLEQLVTKVAPVDLLLVEGFKRDRHEKIEVWRAEVDKALIAPDDPTIVAVASDGVVPRCPVPVLDLNDAEAVAAFVVERCGLG